MAFKTYLVEKYDTAHENLFFRQLSTNLEKAFADKAGDHFLIGNISCEGHPFDGLFICNGQISVLELKNYGGLLVFSENKQWRLRQEDGSDVYMDYGQSYRRNPFKQVEDYKWSLVGFLKKRQQDILSANRSEVRWDHVGGIVVFHQNVKHNPSSIPQKIGRWFKVADKTSIVDLLKALGSAQLRLNDKELSNLLDVLGVTENQLLEKHQWTDEVAEKEKEFAEKASKLVLVKKLISSATSQGVFKRALNFYQTMLQVERFKQPETSVFYKYPLDKNQTELSKYRLDITSSEEFHEIFLKNLSGNYPKNLFVGVHVNVDGTSYPLLYEIKMPSDFSNREIIEVNLNSFSLYTRELEKMGMDEDVLEELSTAINDADSIAEKVAVLGNFIGGEVILEEHLIVSLASESLFTINVSKEIKQIIYGAKEVDLKDTVFHSILLREPIKAKTAAFNFSPYIEVTPLNPSQREAVRASFDKPLTVVTGPPGNGKSQVVINTIANAIANNQSVLFASKNNKAIDTVKERLDDLLQEPYLVRMGSKQAIEEIAKPALNNFIARSQQKKYSDQSSELELSKRKLESQNAKIEELKMKISRIAELELSLTDTTNQLEIERGKFNQWLDSLEKDVRSLFVDANCSINIDVNELGILSNKLKSAGSSFFGRLLFNLFQKSDAENRLKQINGQLESEIKEYVNEKCPWAHPDKDLSQSGQANLKLILELHTTSKKLKGQKNDFSSKIENLSNKVQIISEELETLKANKAQYEAEIDQLQASLPKMGLSYLNTCINEKLRTIDGYHLGRYVGFIPNKNLKDKELKGFIESTAGAIKNLNALCMTSLSVSNSLPLQQELVDLLIIDEASQCDVASALPLIYRAKRTVVIGDPLQLRHITSVTKFEQEYAVEVLKLEETRANYVEDSLFHYAKDSASQSGWASCFLDEHYRCHPEIIQFSANFIYKPKGYDEMKIRTSESDFHIGNTGINWVDVKGEMPTKSNQNINKLEAEKCIALAKAIFNKYPEATIGIISPFKHQKALLQNLLPPEMRGRVKADTVHQFQGDEKDVVLLSTVVSEGATENKHRFINQNEYLINVAVTRAKSALYIVGNHEYCKNTSGKERYSPLADLANYTENLGRVLK